MKNDREYVALNGTDEVFRLTSSWLVKKRSEIEKECFEFDMMGKGAEKRYNEEPLSDEFADIAYEAVWCYIGEVSRNKLIIRYSLTNDELDEVGELNLDVKTAIDCLMGEPFSYVIKKLNKNVGITVFINHVHGTTSDFVIYYPEYHLEDGLIYGEEYKYMECKVPGEFNRVDIISKDKK